MAPIRRGLSVTAHLSSDDVDAVTQNYLFCSPSDGRIDWKGADDKAPRETRGPSAFA